MKIHILILMTLMSSLVCLGQQFEVVSLRHASSDLTAATYPRADLNSKSCALLKVPLPMADVSFEGNVIGDVAYKSGEYWVYLSDGSKNVVVKHASCVPARIDFADYGIDNLSARQTYVLNINPPKSVLFDVLFKVSPQNAILTVDNVEYDMTGGIATVPLTAKDHTYMVVAPGYYSQSNVFRVNEQGKNKIVVELDSRENTQVSNTVPQANAAPSANVAPSSNMVPSSNISAHNAVGTGSRIGIYDEKKIYGSLPEMVKAQEILNSTSAKYESEYAKLTDELKNKYDALQKEQATLPAAIVEKRTNELVDLQKKIEAFGESAKQDFEKMQKNLMQPSVDKCQAALNIVKNNLRLASVQDVSAAKLTGIEYVDITNDIINMVLGKSTMPQNAAIGVYDSNRAFNQLAQVVAAQKELADMSATYEKEYKVLTDNVNNCFNEYQKMHNDDSVPQVVKDRKAQEVAAYQKKAEDYAKKATESLQKRQNEVLKPLQEKFNAAVSLISSRRGLVSTQDSTAARLGGGVNYVDITDEIISMLQQ